MVDRHRPAKDLLRLIQLLSAHKASGLSLDEISSRLEMSPRTAQRYLSALQDIEPGLTYKHLDGTQKKYWSLPSGGQRLPASSAEKLVNLTTIASFMRAQGHSEYGEFLEEIRDALQAATDKGTLARIDPDLEVFEERVGVVHRPGPRAEFDPATKSTLLKAITRQVLVEFLYTDVRGLKTTKKKVVPYAIVVGTRSYLVARDVDAAGIRNYALSGISELSELDEAAPPEGFDAREYIAQSFGAFHDGQFHRWRLFFKPSARHEVMGYQFHPTEEKVVLPDGSVEVSFYCESIREVAYECFRWSEHLERVYPTELQSMIDKISAEMIRIVAASKT